MVLADSCRFEFYLLHQHPVAECEEMETTSGPYLARLPPRWCEDMSPFTHVSLNLIGWGVMQLTLSCDHHRMWNSRLEVKKGGGLEVRKWGGLGVRKRDGLETKRRDGLEMRKRDWLEA